MAGTQQPELTCGSAEYDRGMPIRSPFKAPGSRQRPGVFLMINSLETGGSERQFAAVASALSPDSFRVQLGCHVQRGTFLEGFRDIASFRMGGSLYRGKSILSRLRLARYLHKLDAQITHSFDFYTNLSLVPAARLARVPVVIGSQRQLGDLLSPAQSKTQLTIFRWCDAVVCNSRAAADRLRADGLADDKIRVIGNGVPDLLFSAAEPALPRIPGRLRVGMIARMNSRAKNHDLFLRCAAVLHAKLANVDFVLVGDGPLRAELEASASRLGLADCVHFLGDRRDIPEILASLDVSVLPSASESLSNVVIESMAAGVPVVASRVGGNVELLDDERGILVSSSEPSDFAAAVERLCKDSSLARLFAGRAKTFAMENFSLEKMGRHHMELYEELLRRKKWRPRKH